MSISKKKLVIGALVVAIVAIGIALTPRTTPPQPVPALTRPDLNELATYVNKDRTDAGLAPLVRDPALDASAKDKCADMVAKHYWEHVAPDGTKWSDFIKRHVSLPPSSFLGENLSANWKNATGINNGWMGSPEHRANILRPQFTEVGYAICDVNATTGAHAGNYTNVIVQTLVANKF